ncbi:MAG: pyridoxal-phosphate dependent enzyme [Streptosporangiales bacterium]|nr:pyridoxal-phosphate dependent enzyme [Streptosporangiales bacterium]
MTTKPLSVQHIEEASRTIDPVFRDTAQFSDEVLSRELGRDIVVKVETLNPIRSFKGRGAGYFIQQVPAGHHVVCASAGNFGQAIAYAGRQRDVPVRVYAATNANPMKVERMRLLGADVVQVGDDFDAAKDAARAYVAEGDGRLFVEDGKEPRISEGAGSIAVELAPLDLDVVLVPVGNGALITGIARWLKEHSPRTRVVGVCAAGAPAMVLSWRGETERLSAATAQTMADGIAVRVPIPEAVDWMRADVDDMLLVDEEHIMTALRMVRDTLGLLLEPAAVVGIAALLQHSVPSGATATILTGSNFSADLFAG